MGLNSTMATIVWPYTSAAVNRSSWELVCLILTPILLVIVVTIMSIISTVSRLPHCLCDLPGPGGCHPHSRPLLEKGGIIWWYKTKTRVRAVQCLYHSCPEWQDGHTNSGWPSRVWNMALELKVVLICLGARIRGQQFDLSMTNFKFLC